MAEGRWRWETRGAISAQVSMARRVLDFDLQQHIGHPLPPALARGSGDGGGTGQPLGCGLARTAH
eukprot:15450022-Alexandrium_andersonii.AAC.1